MKTNMIRALIICAFTVSVAVLGTGCATQAKQTRVLDMSPTHQNIDESFTGSKSVFGFEKDDTRMDIETTNNAGEVYIDKSTSYSSGFHMPGTGLFRGLFGCIKGAFAVPTGLIIESGNNACIYPVSGGVYDVGGGCYDRSWGHVNTTVGFNGPCFQGYGSEGNGASGGNHDHHH